MLQDITKIDLVLNFFNRDDILVEKMMGRRVCPECNKNFNVASIDTADGYRMAPLLPKGTEPHLCDNHGKERIDLVTRADDKEEIIMERLQIYKAETLPILDFYKSESPQTLVVDIEAKRGKEDYPMVKQLLKEALAQTEG